MLIIDNYTSRFVYSLNNLKLVFLIGPCKTTVALPLLGDRCSIYALKILLIYYTKVRSSRD